MTGQEYQTLALRTRSNFYNENDTILAVAMTLLALGGEVGELENKFKKKVERGETLNYREMKEEIGDVLWYLTSLSNILGTNLDEIMAENIKKLEARYPQGKFC